MTGIVGIVLTLSLMVSCLVMGTEEPWLLLFHLLETVVQAVLLCVQRYFDAFIICWNVTGEWLVEMIVAYIDFLGYMCSLMLVWPTNLVLTTALNCALFWAWLIVRTVWPQRKERGEPLHESPAGYVKYNDIKV